VKVRILSPIDSENLDIVESLETLSPNIELREHEPTTSTVLVVDRQELFTSELRNNDATDTYEALGFSVHSNSKPTIESHIALFESLWKQKELYSQLQMSATDLELANQQLKMHDKMQTEFINIAAHELRTPIQPILGMADLLASKHEENEQNDIQLSRSDLELIIRNAKRLEKLSSDILEVSRIESDLLHLHKERVNLNDIIIAVVQEANLQAKKSPSVQFEYSPKDIWMNVDKGRIMQVMSNIIDNAVKFTEIGKISISTHIEQDGKIAVVSVEDTGSGIDIEIVPRLFTKFATRSERGTGLGLYISKNIIEAHDGGIWAKNKNNGAGAIFTFTLPITNN
jgi:signal transduction histidine kinase